MSQSQILHAGLQKKLDGLDELIDTLEREKEKERDTDLREIEEAKEVLQMAREDYSRGDPASLQISWLRAERAESWCISDSRDLSVGQSYSLP